jgi:hypothetical protein
MVNLNDFGSLKKKLIYFITSTYILSFFFQHYITLNFEILRFSIVEVIFIILIFVTLLIYKKNFIIFVFKFEKKNIFEVIIYSMLILKLIKYFLNLQNSFNLYELLIWMYMIAIYTIFKFHLNIDKKLIYYVENSFIAISLIISIHIIFLFLLYKLKYQSDIYWTIRETIYLPYLGTSSVHFKSIFLNYNQPAHLVAPGFLFLLNRSKDKLFIISLLIFYFVVLYLIKSKFFFIFFGILGIYFIIKHLTSKNIKLIKIFLLLSIVSLGLFYFIITHFILVKKGTINSSNIDLFMHYYFTDFVLSLNNYDVYGSLFLKYKYVAIEIAKNFNYILYDSLNFSYNHHVVLKYFNVNNDPHSEYFGALANYGIIGFLILFCFPIYMISLYLKNFNETKIYRNNFIYFLIIISIFIEAIIIDLFHTQFVWIIFCIYIFNINVKKNILIR